MSKNKNSIRPITFACDFCVLVIGAFFVFYLWLIVFPTKRGFFCHDESLRYPRKKSTVPNKILYSIGFGIPILSFLITGLVRQRLTKNPARGLFLNKSVPQWIIQFYQQVLYFLIGAIGSQILTHVGKLTVGRLRPDFIAACGPNVTLTYCTADNPEYIEDYSCLAGEDSTGRSSRTSFPSAHASFSSYAMIYLVIYLQVKWTGRKTKFIKILVQTILLIITYFTSLSRIMDNKHHVGDVIAGGLIGIFWALITAKYIAHLQILQPTAAFESSEFEKFDKDVEIDEEMRKKDVEDQPGSIPLVDENLRLNLKEK